MAFFWPLVTEVFRCLFAFQEFCIRQFPFVWNSVVICIDLVMERFNWVGQSGGITISCQFSQTAQFSPRIYQPCLSHQCVLTKSKIGTQNLSIKTLPTRKPESVLTKSNSHWIGFTLMSVKSAVVDVVQNYTIL